jgi:hypothetical protein
VGKIKKGGKDKEGRERLRRAGKIKKGGKDKRGQAGGKKYTVQFNKCMRRQRVQYIKTAGAIKNHALILWR